MPVIQMSFKTTKSTNEIRTFIEETVLTRPEATMLMHEHHWEADVLHASGSLGTGTISILRNEVVIDIELSMFGVAARSRIEEALKEQFTKIED
jgi:hypothetical protein